MKFPWMIFEHLQHPAVLIRHFNVTDDDPSLPGLIQSTYHELEGTRKVGVVGIKPAYHIALSHPEAFVQGVRLSPIRFGDPFDMRVFLQDIDRPITGAAVNNNMLKIKII